MSYAYKIEYVLNNEGDTTIVSTKRSMTAFIKVIESLDGYIVRINRVIIAS